jgi:hypothetical protein
VPAVQPVPGTAAAAEAVEQATKAAQARGGRPHIVLDTDLEHRPKGPKVRGVPPGMSPSEAADRIVAEVLKGTGPILLVAPGTLGGQYDNSMLATAREFARKAPAGASIASIPYPNGVIECVTRYLKIGIGPEQNVLALVIKRLRAAAPHRPILLAGESQGAWLISDTLHQDPSLAAAVTRVVLFAKPGFVKLPPSIGAARLGASMLPPNVSGVDGVLEFRHTDDIVPSLFGNFGPHVFKGWIDSLKAGRGMEYLPHHYDWHDEEAVRYLLDGIRPDLPTVHESGSHPTHRSRA